MSSSSTRRERPRRSISNKILEKSYKTRRETIIYKINCKSIAHRTQVPLYNGMTFKYNNKLKDIEFRLAMYERDLLRSSSSSELLDDVKKSVDQQKEKLLQDGHCELV